MPIFNNILAGASGQTGGAAVAADTKSLRFEKADSAHLNRTFGAGSQTTWTCSYWHKNVDISNVRKYTLVAEDSNNDYGYINIRNDNRLEVAAYVGSAYPLQLLTQAQYRDPSAWYHFVIAYDTTQATASDRVKIYVNGVRVTDFLIESYPTPNYAGNTINSASNHYIARVDNINGTTDYTSALLADYYFIDGQALAETDFGEFDATTGVWNPIAYTGSVGTNGFHLKFDNTSNLGEDSAGSNDWTATNFGVPTTYTFSNGWTANLLAGFPGTNCFNGTGTGLTIGGSNVVSTWTAPTSLPFSTLTIRGAHDGAEIYINGTNVTSQFTSGLSTVTVTGVSSPLSTIALDGSSGAGNPRITSVVIDGERLVDNRPYPGNGNDSLFDSPTNGTQTDTGAGGEVSGNYATWNPLKLNTNGSLANGNLDWSSSTGGGMCAGTIGVSSDKWYWEVTVSGGTNCGIGVFDPSAALTTYIENSTLGIAYYGSAGSVFYYGGSAAYGSSFGSGDIIGVALDLDNGKIYFSKNGTWQNSGDPAAQTNPARTGLSGTYAPAIDAGASSAHSASLNTGQRAFAYTAPSGFKAVCTANFDTPTIEDPSTVMDVVTWTGDGSSTRTLTGLGFNPDLVWLKSRSVNNDHNLFDSVRGVEKTLSSNLTAAEVNQPIHGYVTAFNSNGFSVAGGSLGDVNYSSRTYVGWTWDAGTSTASNTSGTITSQVRANISAGFSVVTYNAGPLAPATGATVGHGLGVAPEFIVVKDRTNANPWGIYHTSLGPGVGILFNTGAASSYPTWWDNTAPTSSVFSINSDIYATAQPNDDYVAYCWAPVEGYSAFGSYTGNGSPTDGPFVYTGFRPAWILVKRTDSGTTAGWTIFDNKRVGYNPDNNQLYPNQVDGDGAADMIDILSNGFKNRTNNSWHNASGGTYIYAAFAEHPFKIARAR